MGIDFCNSTQVLNLRSSFGAKDVDVGPLYEYLCPVIIAICSFSIIFNIALISISRQSKAIHRSKILLLSLNLAVTDIIASILNLATILFNSYLTEVFNLYIDEIVGNCPLLFMELLRYSALIASVLHLLALACLHYEGTADPLHYRSKVFFSEHLSRTINMISICCWIIPLTIMIAWFSSSPCQGFQTSQCSHLFLLGFAFRYMVLSLFALPLIIMSVIYLRIFIIISRHQKGHRLRLNERSTLTRGVMSAAVPLGTAAAVNLPELLIATQQEREELQEEGEDEDVDDDDDDDDDGYDEQTDGRIRCAACAAQALLDEDASISMLSEGGFAGGHSSNSDMEGEVAELEVEVEAEAEAGETNGDNENENETEKEEDASKKVGPLATSTHTNWHNPNDANQSAANNNSTTSNNYHILMQNNNNNSFCLTNSSSATRVGAAAENSSSSSGIDDSLSSLNNAYHVAPAAISLLPSDPLKLVTRWPAQLCSDQQHPNSASSSGRLEVLEKAKVAVVATSSDPLPAKLEEGNNNNNNNSYYRDCDSKLGKRGDHDESAGEFLSKTTLQTKPIIEDKAAENSFKQLETTNESAKARKRGFLFLIRPTIMGRGQTSEKSIEKLPGKLLIESKQEPERKHSIVSTTTKQDQRDGANKTPLAIDVTPARDEAAIVGGTSKSSANRIVSLLKSTEASNTLVSDDNFSSFKDKENNQQQQQQQDRLELRKQTALSTHKLDSSSKAKQKPSNSPAHKLEVQVLKLPSSGNNDASANSDINNDDDTASNQTVTINLVESRRERTSGGFRIDRQQSNPISSTSFRSTKCTCDKESQRRFDRSIKLARSNTIGGAGADRTRTRIGGTASTSYNKRYLSRRPQGATTSTSQRSSISFSAVASSNINFSNNKLSTSLKTGSYRFSRGAAATFRSHAGRLVGRATGRTSSTLNSTSNATLSSSTYESQRRNVHASAVPQTNTKALITTLYILGTYLMSYAPAIIYHALTCADGCQIPLYTLPFSTRVLIGSLTTLLLIGKSILDPLIYSYRTTEIQSAINRYLSKRRSRSSMANSMYTSQRFNKSFNNNNSNYNKNNNTNNNVSNMNISNAGTHPNSSIKILSSLDSNSKVASHINHPHRNKSKLPSEKEISENHNHHLQIANQQLPALTNTQNNDVIALLPKVKTKLATTNSKGESCDKIKLGVTT